MTRPLVVRRVIAATREALYDAWTDPEKLLRWWGPGGVRCTHAEVDPRVGGRYRLGNELPDGRVVFIEGEFLLVDRPCELVYTWRIEPSKAPPERVTVRFEQRSGGTEVIVSHERIVDERTRLTHEQGWRGCLDGLAAAM